MDPRLQSPVDLWLVSLDSADAVSAQDLSHAEDRARCDEIVVPRRKRQFTFRRRALRYVLGRYLPRYDLDFEAAGKPFVRSSSGRMGLHFSTSSSRDVCAVCVGRTDTGVDIEANPPAVDLADIVTQFMPGVPSSSYAALRTLDATEASPPLRAFRQHLAVMSWCRLEAYTKLHGRTLHRVLFEEHEKLPEAFGDGHHVVAVANLDYVCVIAQTQPFRVARIHQIDFARIAREQG
jgi:phosphopantetheinyl transferase